MTLNQQIVTILLCALATMTTRFLPFIVFSEKKETPEYVKFLGKYLPSAVFGMLIIYCLKDVDLLSGNHGIPEFLSIFVTAMLHIKKRNMLISIAGGTFLYIALINFVFI